VPAYRGYLDILPFVSNIYKKFLRIEDYFNPNALYPMVTILASRGCPYRCNFCLYPQTMMGRRYRTRKPEKVAEEMQYIEEVFPNARSVFFEDDTFTVSKDFVKMLCEEIMQRGVSISWSANARADVDFDTLRLMKRAGLRELCVGFESGDERSLSAMEKGISRKEMKRFVMDAKKAGILVHGCFVVGLPHEGPKELERTLDWALELSPDTVQFYPIMVYPGTRAFELYKKEGLLAVTRYRDWLTPSGLHNATVNTKHLKGKELVKFCDHARRRFYLRPSYLIYKLIQSIRTPREIRRNVKAFRRLLFYLFHGSDMNA